MVDVDPLTRLSPLLEKWLAAILPTVRDRVSDARGHAANARTEALKRTPDGRSSLLKINANPSYKAALARLDQLWEWLAGPSEVSLDGKIRDAREDFYTAAALEHFQWIPAEYRSRTDPEPTRHQVRQIRAAAIHGYDPRRVLDAPIRRAKVTLKATLERAARKGTGASLAVDQLDGWERQTTRALIGTVSTLLGDSLAYSVTTSGLNLIRPDLIDDSIPESQLGLSGDRP